MTDQDILDIVETKINDPAKSLIKDIANATPWKFKGAFDNYVPPTLLHLFCKHTIQCSYQVKSPSRIKSLA